MQDLRIGLDKFNRIFITVAEQQAIIDANEIEDAWSIQKDLEKLVVSKDKTLTYVKFHVTTPSTRPIIRFGYTRNKNWSPDG